MPLTRRYGWDEVKEFRAPSHDKCHGSYRTASLRSSAEYRIGKLLIDYLGNGRGASTVAAFSVRARQHGRVDAFGRIHGRNYWRTRQGITATMRRAVGITR